MKSICIALAIFAVSACGAETKGPDVCAMNPIAYGCGLESVQGAVAGGFKTTASIVNPTYSYVCDGSLNSVSGTLLTTAPHSPLFFWTTAMQAVDWANPLPTRNSMKAKGATTSMVMTTAMDGPYHVLYNTSSFSGYGLVTSFNGNANLKPVIIPAYGVWIYAPNERPDYPTGAEVITFDPDPSVPFVPGDGRCSSARVQFVSSL